MAQAHVCSQRVGFHLPRSSLALTVAVFHSRDYAFFLRHESVSNIFLSGLWMVLCYKFRVLFINRSIVCCCCYCVRYRVSCARTRARCCRVHPCRIERVRRSEKSGLLVHLAHCERRATQYYYFPFGLPPLNEIQVTGEAKKTSTIFPRRRREKVRKNGDKAKNMIKAMHWEKCKRSLAEWCSPVSVLLPAFFLFLPCTRTRNKNNDKIKRKTCCMRVFMSRFDWYWIQCDFFLARLRAKMSCECAGEPIGSNAIT